MLRGMSCESAPSFPPPALIRPAAEASAPSKPAARRGFLRYRADWWSIAWVQLTIGFSLAAWVFDLPLWAMALLALPVFFFRSSCAYVQHNQGHLPVFRSRVLNFLYDMQLALMTGYVTPIWELQHSRGHHRYYLQPARDPASILDPKTDAPMARWRYCLFGNLKIVQDAFRVGRSEAREGRPDPRPRMVLHLVVATALAATLLYLNWFAFVCFIAIPCVSTGWFVWHISYDHHLGIPMTNHYDGSKTHLGHSFNRLTFNIGHHAAHHEKPTLHWSLLPKRSAEVLHKLDPATVSGTLEPEVAQYVRAAQA